MARPATSGGESFDSCHRMPRLLFLNSFMRPLLTHAEITAYCSFDIQLFCG